MNFGKTPRNSALRRALAYTALTAGATAALFSTRWLPPMAATATTQRPTPTTTASASAPQVQRAFGQMPLSFEINRGQAAAPIKFMARGANYGLFLTAQAAVISLHQPQRAATQPARPTTKPQTAQIKLRLLNANPAAQPAGQTLLAGKSNYFSGNDPARWQTDVPNYAQVAYEEVYPGIALIWHGRQAALEYDFIVQPGADPQRIALAFDGAQTIRVAETGALHLRTAAGELVQHAPVVYQETPQGRQVVPASYEVNEAAQVRFALGAYDTTRPLVIDPVLNYAAYVGGSGADEVESLAVDASGNVYVAGTTESADFAATLRRGEAGLLAGDSAAFVRKLDANGQLVYSVVLDGRSGDEAHGVAVDQTGAAYVVGQTASRNFPLQSALQSTPNPGVACLNPLCIGEAATASDAFVAKLNAAGNGLVFSTFLGGGNDDSGHAIALGADNSIYVTGRTDSGNFPTLNAFQEDQRFSGYDIFLAVLAPTGQALRYSTYLCTGDDLDIGFAVAVDATGNAYIAGRTDGDDLPVRGANGAPPFRANYVAGFEAFAAKFNPNATGNASLVYATYLGGAGTDQAFGIAVDDINQAYLVGQTGSVDFPLQAAPGAPVLDSQNLVNEAFLTCLNAAGSGAVFSTFLGGSSQEAALAVALDTARNVYVAGKTSSTDFATNSEIQTGLRGGFDASLTKVRAGGTSVEFTLVLGSTGNDEARGVALDETRRIYLAGVAGAGNLTGAPTPAPGSTNGFVARLAQELFVNPDSAGVFDAASVSFNLRNALDSGPASFTAFFGATGDLPITGDWDGDGVSTIGLFRPSTGQFFLHNRIESTGSPDITFNFGQAGDLPIAGDWNGDGVDTVGVFRAGEFLLRATNNANSGRVERFAFGLANALPVAGDWDGDGRDSIGVFEYPGAGNTQLRVFRLRNSNSAGPADSAVGTFSIFDKPLAGDWNGDGVDTIGVLRVSGTATTFLLRRVTNGDTSAANLLSFSITGSNADDLPVSGDWDGLP